MAASLITIPEKVWTIVASNITYGVIKRPINMGEYTIYYTTRAKGTTAPSDLATINPILLDAGKAQLFIETENIISGSPIDIYFWAFNADSDSADSAKIMVDL